MIDIMQFLCLLLKPNIILNKIKGKLNSVSSNFFLVSSNF